MSKIVHTSDSSGRERREVHFDRAAGAQAPQSRMGGSRGSGGSSPVGDIKGISSAAPRLFAQYLICGVFISASVLTTHKSYLDRMSEVLWRLTAVTALYFCLALISMNKVMTEVAVQFGWLIVAVVFLKEAKTIGQTFNVLAGQGSGLSDTELTADNTTDAPPHEYLQ